MKMPNRKTYHPMQTLQWGRFRKEWGNEVLFTDIGIITVHKIPVIGKRLGMLIRGPKPDAKIIQKLKQIALEEDLIFIKIEPNVVVNPHFDVENKDLYVRDLKKIHSLFEKNVVVPGKTLFTPTSFWIDLKPKETEIFNRFKSKTRYNINYAIKKGVVVVEDNSDEMFEKYISLMRETVKRQKFYAHNEKYHFLMWKHLHKNLAKKGKKPIAHLLVAKRKKEILTIWIVFTCGDFLFYPYGASSTKHKNLQANSLMMWEAIRFGKKLGLKWFDLWGREEGKGFTKFKEGFSPYVATFLGTWDAVYNKRWYKVFKIADSLRWIILRAKSKLVYNSSSF